MSDQMKAKRAELLARLRKPGGAPLTDEEVKLLMTLLHVENPGALSTFPNGLKLGDHIKVLPQIERSGPAPASSPIGGSGSYVTSGFSGNFGRGSMGGYSIPASSGPSGGLVVGVGLVVLGLLAAVVYGGWLLVRWLF
jgi:hypothetical protein